MRTVGSTSPGCLDGQATDGSQQKKELAGVIHRRTGGMAALQGPTAEEIREIAVDAAVKALEQVVAKGSAEEK